MKPSNDNAYVPGRSYTPDTLGQRWGCSAQHIRDLVACGELPSFRVGRLIRISVDTVRDIECQKSEQSYSGAGGTPSGQTNEGQRNGAPSAPKIVQRPNVG